MPIENVIRRHAVRARSLSFLVIVGSECIYELYIKCSMFNVFEGFIEE